MSTGHLLDKKWYTPPSHILPTPTSISVAKAQHRSNPVQKNDLIGARPPRAPAATTMRLNAEITKTKGHTYIVSAVGWSSSNELFSCGDDHTVCRWNARGELEGKVRDDRG